MFIPTFLLIFRSLERVVGQEIGYKKGYGGPNYIHKEAHLSFTCRLLTDRLLDSSTTMRCQLVAGGLEFSLS
jgi:hypothetical protein